MKQIQGVTLAGFLLAACLNGGGVGSAEGGLDQLITPQTFRPERSSSSNEDLYRNGDARPIPKGGTLVLADLEGPGVINHIWTTVGSYDPFNGRSLVVRMYWDGAEEASVEVPLGDFFGVGHSAQADYVSQPVAVSSHGRARNCYWKMPFQKSARITVSNDSEDYDTDSFYFYVDWERHESLPEGTPYFHVRYDQAFPAQPGDYTILETTGTGHYVGTVYSAQQVETGWYGEGDDRFYIDGEEFPSLRGTGTEDYFGDAWGFRKFSTPYFGVSLWEGYYPGDRSTAYRWHIEDPVPFKESLKVSIEHRGSVFDETGKNLGQFNERPDWVSSAAFWYQLPAVGVRANLPPAKERVAPYTVHHAADLVVNASPAEAVQKSGPTVNFAPGVSGGTIEFVFELKESGLHQINALIWHSIFGGIYEAFLDGESLGEPIDFYASGHDALWVSFDLHPLDAGSHTLRFEGRGLSPKRRTQAQPLNAFGMTYLMPLRLEDMEGYGRVLAELKEKGK